MQETWFDPWVGKIPWSSETLPTPVFWPGEYHGLYSPWGCRVRQDWAIFHSLPEEEWRSCSFPCCVQVVSLSLVLLVQGCLASHWSSFLSCIFQIYFIYFDIVGYKRKSIREGKWIHIVAPPFLTEIDYGFWPYIYSPSILFSFLSLDSEITWGMSDVFFSILVNRIFFAGKTRQDLTEIHLKWLSSFSQLWMICKCKSIEQCTCSIQVFNRETYTIDCIFMTYFIFPEDLGRKKKDRGKEV